MAVTRHGLLHADPAYTKHGSASGDCSWPVCCADAAAANVQRACAQDAFASTYAAQHMFSIYVHSAPDFEGYQDGSIFQGR